MSGEYFPYLSLPGYCSGLDIFAPGVRSRQPLLLSARPGGVFEQVSCLLGNHDRRGIGVTVDDGWHDGCIYHTQTEEAMDPQLGIHHRQGIADHLAGADRVIEG